MNTMIQLLLQPSLQQFPVMVEWLTRGVSRKLFWEGHIALESPKTTNRDAESVEWEMSGQGGGGLTLPSQLGASGERCKLSQRDLGWSQNR